MKVIRYLQKIFDENSDFIFKFFVICFACISFFKIFASSGLMADTMEHIHASWLVSEGFVPYRDFFEHHNPFLWFLLAPLAKVFERSVVIIPVVRFLAVCFYLGTIYLMYRFSIRFLCTKKTAQSGVLVLLSVPCLFTEVMNIRPDILMLFFFILGLYYFLLYLENQKRKELIFSYVSMVVSFLFLQKVVIFGIGFAIANAWLFLQKRIKMKDALIAGCVALVVLGIFFIWLFYVHAFNDWFYYNFTFNAQLKQYFSDYKSLQMLTYWSFVISAMLILYTYKYNDQSIAVLLSAISGYLFLLFNGLYVHYYIPYFVLVLPFLGEIFALLPACRFLLLFSVPLALCGIFPISGEWEAYQRYFDSVEYYTEHLNPGEKVLNMSVIPANLFNPNMNYYWFGFANVVIIDVLYNMNAKFDFNQVLQENKPRYLFIQKEFDTIYSDHIAFQKCGWFWRRNKNILNMVRSKGDKTLLDKIQKCHIDFWKIDMDWIDAHYEEVYPSVYKWID